MPNAATKPRGDFLKRHVAGLSAVIHWLRGSGVSTRYLASYFRVPRSYIRQLAFRGGFSASKLITHQFLTEPLHSPDFLGSKPTESCRRQLSVRLHEDSVVLGGPEKRKLAHLEETVEGITATLLTESRFERCLSLISLILSEIGFPAHHKRIRLLARLRHLISETLLYSGRSASALDQALRALHLSHIAFNESEDSLDRIRLARSVLLASEAHLQRAEPSESRFYLNIYEKASEGTSPLSADYYRQLGVVAFQLGDDSYARKNYTRAMKLLPDTIEPAHEPRHYDPESFTARRLKLLAPVDWDGAQDLLKVVRARFDFTDVRVSMHANWTAACGLIVDSPMENARALEILDEYAESATGFGREATIASLLRMTPDLPARLRPSWVRRALCANAFSNS